MSAKRDDRRHAGSPDDQRNRFARDRDRILYSSAFRRLAGITEIVRAGEDDVFHTRQQHTYKVAQIGRRLAQIWAGKEGLYEVDAEVVEAACMAHDLGHPPFGHAGESTLNKLVIHYDDPEGFEGNAQTFRIITKLAKRFDQIDGLDLSRATLNACLKYPWMRDIKKDERKNKWSAFLSEKDDFDFARQGYTEGKKSAEAELMDWADDIAYSVHDLEDFHRCGALPWNKIWTKAINETLVERTLENWFDPPNDAAGRLRTAYRELYAFMIGTFLELFENPYEGTARQRQLLRTMNSQLIGQYIRAITVNEIGHDQTVSIDEGKLDQVRLLKQITRDYIIENPSLGAQQFGQAKIIEQLFHDFYKNSAPGEPPDFMPMRLQTFWHTDAPSLARMVCDCIASLTESEATKLHARLNGLSGGSVLDPIAR